MHKMHMTVLNCSKQKMTIQQLLNQNTYLIVDMTSSAQINLLISKSLLFHSKLKNCKLFHEDCRITQCFNCYEYRHVVRVCWKEKKCDMCAASGHDDWVCSF